MNARSAELVVPTFEVAERTILVPSGLDERRLTQVLDTIMTRGVDYADLYFQLSREESWAMEDGMVKEGSHSIEQGVGVRAISGEKTGFAYTDEVLLPALLEASDAARAIARSGANQTVKTWQRAPTHKLYLPIDPLDAIKDDLLRWLGEGPFYLKLGGRVSYRIEDVEYYEATHLHANTTGPLRTDKVSG